MIYFVNLLNKITNLTCSFKKPVNCCLAPKITKKKNFSIKLSILRNWAELSRKRRFLKTKTWKAQMAGYVLGRFLDSAVVVELGKLTLHASQWVGKMSVTQTGDGRFDPAQQLACQALILLDHAVVVHRDTNNLSYPLALHCLLLHLAEVVVVCHHVSDDRLLVGLFHKHICNITFDNVRFRYLQA